MFCYPSLLSSSSSLSFSFLVGFLFVSFSCPFSVIRETWWFSWWEIWIASISFNSYRHSIFHSLLGGWPCPCQPLIISGQWHCHACWCTVSLCHQQFLAVTKQLYEWYFPSACLSVCHTFFTMFSSSYHHEIFRSDYQWQKWRPCKRSEVKGQGHRGHNPT